MVNQNRQPSLRIHLELTSACNSGCLDCNRFVKQTDILNPSVHIGWFTDEMFDNTFTPEICEQLEYVNFTGTYGESSLHPKFFEFLHKIADRTPHTPRILMETNGGTHNTEWWAEFGSIIKERFGKGSQITFAMDGIDDQTHQKYRRGVPFDKVMDNARAFTSTVHSPENVRWQMIEFAHNAHQFDEAKEMAEAEGWVFNKRRSRLRFVTVTEDGKAISTKTENKNTEVKRKRYSKEDIQVSDTDKKKTEETLSKLTGDYQDTTEIVCEWKRKNQISVDYDGIVWQCCYFSTFNHPVVHLNQVPDYNNEREIMYSMRKENLLWYEDQYDYNWNNVIDNKLNVIMDHRFFTHDLPKSFGNTTQDKEFPRIKRCAKMCGAASREIERKVNNVG